MTEEGQVWMLGAEGIIRKTTRELKMEQKENMALFQRRAVERNEDKHCCFKRRTSAVSRQT